MNSTDSQPAPPATPPASPARTITRLGWPDRLLVLLVCLLQAALVAALLFAAHAILCRHDGDAACDIATPAIPATPPAAPEAAFAPLATPEALDEAEALDKAEVPPPPAPRPDAALAGATAAPAPSPRFSVPAPAFPLDPFFDDPFGVPALPVPDAFFDEPVAATVVRAALEDMRQMRSLFDAGPAWVDSPTRPAVGMTALSNRYEIVLDRVDPASLDVALDGRMLSLAYRESSQTANAASAQSMASRFLLPGPVADGDALRVLPDPANRRATVVVYKPGAAPEDPAPSLN